jgi:hypothetical protein
MSFPLQRRLGAISLSLVAAFGAILLAAPARPANGGTSDYVSSERSIKC